MTMWGIGQWQDADGERVAWEISTAEMGRDIGAASAALRALGVVPGTTSLWCSMLSEAGQFWPYTVGTMVCGAQLSCADATNADAARVAMFCRQLAPRAVFGVNRALLDGLDELGLDLAKVFANVELLAARPDAVGRLQRVGLSPYHFVLVGPAVAVGREPGGPAYVDSTEWQCEEDGEHLAVTNLQPRATEFRRCRSAVRGRVVNGGVLPATVEVSP